jgi:hypothetical protein
MQLLMQMPNNTHNFFDLLLELHDQGYANQKLLEMRIQMSLIMGLMILEVLNFIMVYN